MIRSRCASIFSWSIACVRTFSSCYWLKGPYLVRFSPATTLPYSHMPCLCETDSVDHKSATRRLLRSYLLPLHPFGIHLRVCPLPPPRNTFDRSSLFILSQQTHLDRKVRVATLLWNVFRLSQVSKTILLRRLPPDPIPASTS